MCACPDISGHLRVHLKGSGRQNGSGDAIETHRGRGGGAEQTVSENCHQSPGRNSGGKTGGIHHSGSGDGSRLRRQHQVQGGPGCAVTGQGVARNIICAALLRQIGHECLKCSGCADIDLVLGQ